jgi:hypothetical protein
MLKLIFKSGKAKFRMGDYPEQGTLARKYLMSIFGKNDLFTEMDKLHRWIVERDVAWAKEVGIGGLFSFELMPIHPLVEEFIQGIVWSNMDMKCYYCHKSSTQNYWQSTRSRISQK